MSIFSRNKEEEKMVYHWRIPQWYPNLKPEELDKLKRFFDELIKFNHAINLISVSSSGSADLNHFADCILAAQQLRKKSTLKEIYDIGSGNGLPGIVLAIMLPNTKIVCIDRDTRKTEFLKHVAGSALKLKNVDVRTGGVDSLPEGSVGCAISRGFASISKSLLATRKVLAADAEYYHMKGDIWTRELADIPSQLCTFFDPSLFAQYVLPEKGEKRFLILTKKTKN